MDTGLDLAIKAAGSSKRLAESLGFVPSVIGNWRRNGGIPAAHVPAIAKQYRIPPHVLRPDLFEHPSAYESEAA